MDNREGISEGMTLRRLVSGRIRLVVFITSLIALVVVTGALLLSPKPSVLIRNVHPSRHNKVSVVLCLNQANQSQYTTFAKQIREALVVHHLEHEVIVLSPDSSVSVANWLKETAHHVEVQLIKGSCEEGLFDAFNKAHFSVIMVLGGRVISSLFNQLLNPVIHDHSDLVILEDTSHSTGINKVLSLLMSPLVGAAKIPSSLVFSLNRVAWRSCQQNIRGHDSFLVELLAKCHFKHWSTVSGVVFTPVTRPHSLSLAQVAYLYWSLHPVLCVCGLLLIAAVPIICWRTFISSREISTKISDQIKI